MNKIINFLLFFYILPSSESAFLFPSGAKLQLLKRFHDSITDFFTPDQVSKAIDIATLDIHRGKKPAEILNHLEDLCRKSLTDDQLTKLARSYDLLAEDIGNKGAAVVFLRIKKIFLYAIEPAVAKVYAHSDTPETAYETMLSLFTPEYIEASKQLIRMTLTPTEYKALQNHFGPIFQFLV